MKSSLVAQQLRTQHIVSAMAQAWSLAWELRMPWARSKRTNKKTRKVGDHGDIGHQELSSPWKPTSWRLPEARETDLKLSVRALEESFLENLPAQEEEPEFVYRRPSISIGPIKSPYGENYGWQISFMCFFTLFFLFFF